ncbi:MAG TPA: hypothetical protein VIL77_06270 [Gaiellaceae bacterium]
MEERAAVAVFKTLRSDCRIHSRERHQRRCRVPQHVEREALEHGRKIVALVLIVPDRSLDCAHPYPVAEAIRCPLVAFDCREDE